MANHLDLPRDEAEEILALEKTAPGGDWHPLSSGRIEKWSLAVGVMADGGKFKRDLAVELICLRTMKPFRECYKFGLFKTECGAPRRVYQLDTATVPLGMPGSHDWPHQHIGQDREGFGKSAFPSTFEQAIEHFQRIANISFEEPVESPFTFALKRQ